VPVRITHLGAWERGNSLECKIVNAPQPEGDKVRGFERGLQKTRLSPEKKTSIGGPKNPQGPLRYGGAKSGPMGKGRKL